MPGLIALVTRLDQAEEEAWLAALAAAMPNEALVPLRGLDPAQRPHVDIAAVANPDPADVTGLPNLALIHSLWQESNGWSANSVRALRRSSA